MLLDSSRRFGDCHRTRGGAFDRSTAEVIGSGESPGSVGEHANAYAERFAVGGVADIAVLGRECAAAVIDNPGVCVGSATLVGNVESPISNVFHEQN